MMLTSGKILVVALVLATILVGLGVFLVYLDQKLNKTEKKLKELEQEFGRRS